MTARTVNVIATANTNLAGFDFGFGAMYPSWQPVPGTRPGTGPSTDSRGNWGGRCVSYFTQPLVIPGIVVGTSRLTEGYLISARREGLS